MNDMRCPYKILIADGGEDSTIEQHLLTHENYPHLDYEYTRYQYDETIEDYFIKLENVISRVESEYILLADNDDFYLLDRIPDILAFLDTHKSYVGARGKIVDLTLYDRAGVPSDLTLDKLYLAVANEVPSIENACPFERVEALCTGMSTYDYYANWYCIYRSAPFQQVWKALVTLPIKEVIVIEVLYDVLMALKGKIQIMKFPFYIRQSGTSMCGGTLAVGNEFLERCIVNNALSEFGVAVEQFAGIQKREEGDRLLRAIAAWLEIFVVNIYRVRVRKGVMFRLWQKIKQVPVIGWWMVQIYYRMRHLFTPMQQRRLIRLKSIEPYILS